MGVRGGLAVADVGDGFLQRWLQPMGVGGGLAGLGGDFLRGWLLTGDEEGSAALVLHRRSRTLELPPGIVVGGVGEATLLVTVLSVGEAALVIGDGGGPRTLERRFPIVLGVAVERTLAIGDGGGADLLLLCPQFLEPPVSAVAALVGDEDKPVHVVGRQVFVGDAPATAHLVHHAEPFLNRHQRPRVDDAVVLL
ncbi:Os11g0610480 [Oryza sativa Japonica Group]|uniref:Os11g0609940 protein n=1 Tax=Oryza sativa subsp. japonica TaxID=39947 RepID=A0A0N7KT74_ORYSJ|nr:Os11g0609940 [Oryza sativa Japonica Group]BAT14826.1 Os11g0610480 [Oryza sativa Japonica Group]